MIDTEVERLGEVTLVECREPLAGHVGDDSAGEILAAAAVGGVLARFVGHREIERVAVPIGLLVLALHDVLTARRVGIPVVAGKARAHADQMLEGHSAGAGIEISGQ